MDLCSFNSTIERVKRLVVNTASFPEGVHLIGFELRRCIVTDNVYWDFDLAEAGSWKVRKTPTDVLELAVKWKADERETSSMMRYLFYYYCF